MFVIRPVTEGDLPCLQVCAQQAELGITHLPSDKLALEEMIQRSQQAFAKEVHAPIEEEYLFILEDRDTGVMAGTCGILAKVGSRLPMHTLHIENPPEFPKEPPLPKERQILQLRTLQNVSELCALYLFF